MNNYNKMSKIIGDDLVFSTGKKIYCNGGCISLWISPQNNCAGISYGADGGIDLEDLEEEEIDELVAMVISDAELFQFNAKRKIKKDREEINKKRRSIFNKLDEFALENVLSMSDIIHLIEEFYDVKT